MREELAELMHEIWAGWMNHVFLHCTQERVEGQGSVVIIPGSLVYRWSRQIDTPYDKLSEKEKDSDRQQADKVLALIEGLEEKEELTHAAFLAVVIYGSKHSEGQWHWLCLSEETQEEMLDNAQAEFLKWKARELKAEQRRQELRTYWKKQESI